MFFPGGQMWVEYAAPCVPKPKPIIKAPVVNVPITSTSCDPAAVQALADSVKGQVTAGMDPAQAALVYVEVVDCSVRRQPLTNNELQGCLIGLLGVVVTHVLASIRGLHGQVGASMHKFNCMHSVVYALPPLLCC
jgi:hypothetical protein